MTIEDGSKVSFKPIQSKRTFEEVSSEIKQLVFKGALKPGDKLPSETELARQFNVGRQTVREALRILELSGFIAIQRGVSGGPIIKNTVLDTISKSLIDALLIERISIEDLTLARLEIEKVVLKHVIDKADDSDIRSLQENILRAKNKIQDNLQPFEENIQFHKLLAKASKNHIFLVVVESIMAVVSDITSQLQVDLKRSQKIVKHHENILNSIISRNSADAIAFLEKEFIGKKELLKAHFKQRAT